MSINENVRLMKGRKRRSKGKGTKGEASITKSIERVGAADLNRMPATAIYQDRFSMQRQSCSMSPIIIVRKQSIIMGT